MDARDMTRVLLSAGLVCGGLLMGWGMGAHRLEATSDGGLHRVNRVGLRVGYRPPPFSATDLQGQPHALKDYEGHVLVLHFWASWCPYCRGEIAKLKHIAQAEWQAQGVRVLAVSVDEDLIRLQRFVERAVLPYPVIVDRKTTPSVVELYAIDGIPVTFVLTRDGHIASRLEGSADIEGAVQRALDQSSAT